MLYGGCLCSGGAGTVKYHSQLLNRFPVIAREKQSIKVGSGAIADGETDAKNASVDGP
jgi:hypothetical protein